MGDPMTVIHDDPDDLIRHAAGGEDAAVRELFSRHRNRPKPMVHLGEEAESVILDARIFPANPPAP